MRASYSKQTVTLALVKARKDEIVAAEFDEVLRIVANRLQDLMRSSDVAARIGGDEFAVMLVDTDAKGAEKVAAYLIAKLSKSYDINGIPVTGLSASVGIAAYPATGLDGDELVARADEALYRAKANGKRQYAVAGSIEERQAL